MNKKNEKTSQAKKTKLLLPFLHPKLPSRLLSFSHQREKKTFLRFCGKSNDHTSITLTDFYQTGLKPGAGSSGSTGGK